MIDEKVKVLIFQDSVAEAEERLKKLQELQQQKKVSAKVSVVESSPELAAVMKKLEESQVQLKENQHQMKVMQEQLAELMLKETAKKPPFRKGCDACKTNNKADSCRHCWKCGEDGHKAQDGKCRKTEN